MGQYLFSTVRIVSLLILGWTFGGCDSAGPSASTDPTQHAQDRCGNGFLNPGEVCDDGNTEDGDYCSKDCTRLTGQCGDGVQQTNEGCDDGNLNEFDYCSKYCTVIGRCGDGAQQTSEVCDDGNTEDGEYCSSDCQRITGRCGDNIQQTNEVCDDGNPFNGDYCDAVCKTISGRCGDGTKQTNEFCDGGDELNGRYNLCRTDCSGMITCGDGITQPEEECDQGARNSDTGVCTTGCRFARCGDKHIWAGHELCDDGQENRDDWDFYPRCNTHCTSLAPYCGDEITNYGKEACDDGALNGQYGHCQSHCKGYGPRCGDGTINGPEACDDGNRKGGDYCSADCSKATGRCGDGSKQDNERCDDGEENGLYAKCKPDCTGIGPHCGDHLRNGPEGCDDGNQVAGDGCAPDCRVEDEQVFQGFGARAIAVGQGHACALLTSGKLKCWGLNYYGQLGLGHNRALGAKTEDMGNRLPVLEMGSERKVSDIIAKEDSSCVLLEGGRARCFGESSHGVLGSEGHGPGFGDEFGEEFRNLNDVELPLSVRTRQIALGYQHACSLSSEGDVRCWGDNSWGECGRPGDPWDIVGDTEKELGEALQPISLGAGLKVERISAGLGFTCAVFQNGRVKCWGTNAGGELGLEDRIDRPTSVEEMGGNLPFVDLGTGLKAKNLVSGESFTCALFETGQVKCWGDNTWGQLGLGDRKSRGLRKGQMGDYLPFVNLGTGRSAVALSTGESSVCAILDNGQVKCWGDNSSGQLGLGDVNHRGDRCAKYSREGACLEEAGDEMGDALPYVDLGTGRTAKAIATGGAHTCVILDNDLIKCWGANFFGQLGLGDTVSRGDHPDEMGDFLPYVFLGAK